MRTEVYAMHGIALNSSPVDYRTRNYLDTKVFEEFIANRERKFVRLEASLAGEGDSLTIDDSTRGGMDAAFMARYYGHEVTLFVNGMYTEFDEIYPFAILSCIVEHCGQRRLLYGDDIFELEDYHEKMRFREKLKSDLLKRSSHQESLEFLHDVQFNYELEFEIPTHLRTLTKADIESLIVSGTEIQNHGWTHRHPFSVSWTETLEDIAAGRDWILRNFKKQAPFFAVPFGNSLPQKTRCNEFSAWLMLDDVIEVNVLGSKIINRKVLEVHS